VRQAARARLNSPLNLTGTLEVATSGELTVGDRITADSINLTNNAVLTHPTTTGTATFKVDIGAQTFIIDATSRIDVNGRGYLGGRRPGNPFANAGMTVGFVQGSTTRTGGSYGGLGGVGFNGVAGSGVPNPVYGDFRNPNDAGSGGGNDSFNAGQGGNGGGLIRIVAQTLQLDGTIRANGASATGDNGGGGSGGGIRIDAGILQGTGQISANGGEGSPKNQAGTGDQTGGGGGGRAAIYYQNASGFNFANATATGGVGHGAPNGQNGTVHAEQQIAILDPMFDAPTVMYAQADRGDAIDVAPREVTHQVPSIATLIQKMQSEVAGAVVLQRRLFILDQSAIQNPKSKIDENRYLAMVAEGKLKPFASTAMMSQRSGVSEVSDSHSDNPTLDDLDPIYSYDLNGNRISMIDPTGLTTYTYDTLNRLTSIRNNKGQVTSFTYDALNRRTSMTHANGVVMTYTYDAASQLTRLAHQFGATTINSFDYTYDKIGNRKSKTNRDGMHDYTYDTLNRLIQTTNPLPSNPLETYNYDAVGNRTNSNQNGSSVFNSANELNEDANFTYEYDNNGNMTRKTAKVGGAITTYEYDAENKLLRAVSPSNMANYKYDGLGRRVEKAIIAGSTTVSRYVYDNEDILLELNGSNTIVARYTHGPGIDEPLILEKNNQSFYYHADGLSSIMELTNQSGTVVQRYTYSSFGKLESQLDPNFVQPYTFTSRESDTESQLYHYRTRTYDAFIGRFLQEDPVGVHGAVNLYSYVNGNPIGAIDPLGLDVLDNAANVAAGLGDTISLGLSNWVRKKLEINDVIDECSWSYSIGKWAGWLHGIALGAAGTLNAGARTVLYSGEGALDAARLGKGAGMLLEDTVGGQFLKFVSRNVVELPDSVWKVSSAIFASNAKGEVAVFLRNANPKGILNTVEIPALDLVNWINSGRKVTSVILR